MKPFKNLLYFDLKRYYVLRKEIQAIDREVKNLALNYSKIHTAFESAGAITLLIHSKDVKIIELKKLVSCFKKLNDEHTLKNAFENIVKGKTHNQIAIEEKKSVRTVYRQFRNLVNRYETIRRKYAKI